jgi:hypothetical protein
METENSENGGPWLWPNRRLPKENSFKFGSVRTSLNVENLTEINMDHFVPVSRKGMVSRIFKQLFPQ